MGPTSELENPRERIVHLLTHLCPDNWAANFFGKRDGQTSL